MTIIEEIRKNPEEGARRLERECKPGLMALALRLCHDSGDAEELVNRTLAEAIANIDHLLSQSALFGWMCQILVGCHAKDTRRKSNTEVVYPGELPEVADTDATERIYDEVDASLVRDAIDKLPDEAKEVLLLHYFAGMSVPQIARYVAIPAGTVKSRLHYARKALAAKLGAATEKTGGKAVLLALLLCGITTLGAAAISLIGAFGRDVSTKRPNAHALGRGRIVDASLPGAAGHPTSDIRQSEAFGFRLSTFDLQPSNLSTSQPFNFSTDNSPGEQTMNMTTTTRAAAVVAALAMQAASPNAASGRTVYDAGKALRQNCESGSYANPYTDANGGVWSYHTASGVAPFTGLADFPAHSKMESDTMDGWICQSDGNPAHPLLLVNATDGAVSSYCSSGNQLAADEMMFHPAAYGYAVLRFTVPQDGWYSALASFRDVDYGSPPNGLSGVDVHVTVGSELTGDTDMATTHVTLEDYAGWNAASKRTRRFDYQMPVRYLTQGMRIQFAVGPNVLGAGGHYSDGTGVKVLVVKEDEGRFYDAGGAFTANVAGGYANPYGTAAHGTWHALLSNLGASVADTDFPTWVPQNFEYSFDHDLTAQLSLGTQEPNTVCGFNRPTGGPPYVTANVSGIVSGNTSPAELRVLPAGNASQCTVVRFRPPQAGRYSGSVVVRDIGDIENLWDDGVEVFLVVADQVVTSAVVRAEAHEVLTAHLTFDSTLLATGEPVDIIVSPRSASNANDETALSVIFRREDGEVFDANKSFYAHHVAGNSDIPFSDVLGSGAQWTLVTRGSDLTDATSSPLAGFVSRQNPNSSGLSWWEHSPDSSGGTFPRIAMTTNAVASWDDTYYITPYPRLAIAANEFFVHPSPAYLSQPSPTVRAIVPADGIYRVHGRARDLDNTMGNVDGVRFSLAVDGCVPATGLVSFDRPFGAGCNAEVSAEGNRLWLKAGETIDAIVDPMSRYDTDSTALGVCYEREGAAATSVVNVDFTGTGSGQFSANAARAREGYGDCLSWNALRPGGADSVTVENCYEADGTTRRNVAVALSRTSGAAIATGTAATGTDFFDSFVTSSGTDDAYAFTISKLKKNEPYTLYLYSARGSASGNAAFTVGGVTKGVEDIWSLGATKMLTRFDVVSDARGEIAGTFAAADANSGAFNGLTLVGDLPDYRAPQFTIIIR